jgi:hypothetical protein
MLGAAKTTVSYLALRANMPARYGRSALDELLDALDRRGTARLLEADEIALGIRQAERIARLLRMQPDTCLFRALTRYAALRRAGQRPRFVMGIDANDPDVGHAWIELEGAPFLEPALPTLTRTFEHPRAA